MVLKFRLLSNEIKDFIREFELNSSHTFYDFHLAIIDNLQYDKTQISSFFLTNSSWEKEQEFCLIEMSDSKYNYSIPMEKAVLGDYLVQPRQRLIYVFDFFNDRCLFVELISIRNGDSAKAAVCQSKGHAPAQLLFDAGLLTDPGIQDE